MPAKSRCSQPRPAAPSVPRETRVSSSWMRSRGTASLRLGDRIPARPASCGSLRARYSHRSASRPFPRQYLACPLRRVLNLFQHEAHRLSPQTWHRLAHGAERRVGQLGLGNVIESGHCQVAGNR